MAQISEMKLQFSPAFAQLPPSESSRKDYLQSSFGCKTHLFDSHFKKNYIQEDKENNGNMTDSFASMENGTRSKAAFNRVISLLQLLLSNSSVRSNHFDVLILCMIVS